MKQYRHILPAFPRIPHLPWKPNPSPGDEIATSEQIGDLFARDFLVQEKIDGANCGMTIWDDKPLVRNRNHILRKGYEKDTPAKKQFASIWTWWYEHRELFESLKALCGPVSVYGEWMVQQHGMKYDALPSWFIAHDLYDYEQHAFMAPGSAEVFLKEAGFSVAPSLGKPTSLEAFEALLDEKSAFSNVAREGIVVKQFNGIWQTECYKMVRPDFVQGSLLGDQIKRNELAR